MKKASITILKARLSQFLDAVKSGEEVIVTERGRPIARLTGLEPGGTPTGRLGQLVREGRVRPPTHAAAELPTVASVPADPEGRSLRILLEERAEDR